MKKISYVLISCMLAISMLSGCSVANKMLAKDTMNIVSQSSELKGNYEIVSTIIRKHKGQFTKEEMQEFTEIDANAHEVYSKIQGILKLESFDISVSEVEYLYEVSKDSYVRAKSIISKHEDVFTPMEMTRMKMFDIQLQQLNKSVDSMLKNPETLQTRQALMTIIKVASVSLKIILPLVI